MSENPIDTVLVNVAYVRGILESYAKQNDFVALKKTVDDFFSDDAAINATIDTLKEMASGQDSKLVYLPYESSNLISALGAITELKK